MRPRYLGPCVLAPKQMIELSTHTATQAGPGSQSNNYRLKYISPNSLLMLTYDVLDCVCVCAPDNDILRREGSPQTQSDTISLYLMMTT